MDGLYITPWDVIRRFLYGWAAVFVLLVAVSIYRHFDMIVSTVAGCWFSVFLALLPLVLVIVFLVDLLRLIFK